MYHPLVIERRQAEVEKRIGLKLTRYDVGKSLDIADALSRLKRDFNPEEQAFIKNERLLCALDYEYWTRYCKFLADASTGGGLQTYRDDWESQKIIQRLIQKMELNCYEAWLRGENVDGILIAIHKCRQIGATMKARTLLIHRISTSPHVLAVTASTDDEKVLKLYERDKRILDNLPSWLRPSLGFDEKGQHIAFDKLDSSVLYQEYAQKTGLAQGEQYLIGHMTEVASCENPQYALIHHYFPAIPKSWMTLHIMESTAQGRGGWWHEFVEDSRRSSSKWKLCFIPYYAVTKYSRTPHEGWQPSEVSMAHAHKVFETSFEYTGTKVMLSKEHLYWWESEREEYRRRNELPYFLTNFCATIEESFQHTGVSIFPADLISYYRDQTYVPEAYEIQEG